MAFVTIYGTDPQYPPAPAEMNADGSVSTAYVYGTAVPGSPWYQWEIVGDLAYPPGTTPAPGGPRTDLKKSKLPLLIAGGSVATLFVIGLLKAKRR